jgi:hypothetical protein
MAATKPTKPQFEDEFANIRLLTKKQLSELFPDCDIWEEKFLGLTKSLIAVRDHGRSTELK